MKKILAIGLVVMMAAAVLPAVAQEEAAEPAVVGGGQPVKPGMKVALPCVVYSNCEDEGSPVFVASGWMGSVDDIEYDDCWQEKPRSGQSCIKVTFSNPREWGGIAWQNPANNWGDDEGGVDLTGAKKLTFWARGDKGGEMVEFKMGVIPRNKPFFDTGKASLGRVQLDAAWQKFEMDLTDKDLSRIMTGFVFSVKGKSEPVIFYLDDIVFE